MNVSHPYFTSKHWLEACQATEKKLIARGFNQKQRKIIQQKGKVFVYQALQRGEAIYHNGLIYWKKEA